MMKLTILRFLPESSIRTSLSEITKSLEVKLRFLTLDRTEDRRMQLEIDKFKLTKETEKPSK